MELRQRVLHHVARGTVPGCGQLLQAPFFCGCEPHGNGFQALLTLYLITGYNPVARPLTLHFSAAAPFVLW